VLAIDCAGGVRAITSHAPVMEGGIAGAPASFGRYGGDLVAPGETSGRVVAIRPDGSVVTLVVSGLPNGGDIGVESAGLVPPGSGASGAAYLADRFSKGNRHPGTDSIVRLPGRELIKAGARTVVVRCASSCTARYIAAGPAITHAKDTSRSLAPAVSPGRPAAPGTGAGGRLSNARPEVAAGFHRPAGTPRPKLTTEAK
jgi:hypothetical protein